MSRHNSAQPAPTASALDTDVNVATTALNNVQQGTRASNRSHTIITQGNLWHSAQNNESPHATATVKGNEGPHICKIL